MDRLVVAAPPSKPLDDIRHLKWMHASVFDMALGLPRHRAKVCSSCRDSHKRCDSQRPCGRCVVLNRAALCRDAEMAGYALAADPGREPSTADVSPRHALRTASNEELPGPEERAMETPRGAQEFLLLSETSLLLLMLSNRILNAISRQSDWRLSFLGPVLADAPPERLCSRLLELPPEMFQAIDQQNELDVGLESIIRTALECPARPCFVLRHSSTFHFVHQTVLSPTRKIVAMNEQFTAVTGWSLSHFSALEVDPCCLFHQEDFAIITVRAAELWVQPGTDAVVQFMARTRIMLSDGSFRPFDVDSLYFRSSLSVPVCAIYFLN